MVKPATSRPVSGVFGGGGAPELDDPVGRGRLPHGVRVGPAPALATMYRRFHAFIGTRISGGTDPARGTRGRRGASRARVVDAASAAWALIGLGTISTIGKEVGVLGAAARRRLLVKVGRLLAGLGKDSDKA